MHRTIQRSIFAMFRELECYRTAESEYWEDAIEERFVTYLLSIKSLPRM